jgi:GTPase SAR1 family protein
LKQKFYQIRSVAKGETYSIKKKKKPNDWSIDELQQLSIFKLNDFKTKSEAKDELEKYKKNPEFIKALKTKNIYFNDLKVLMDKQDSKKYLEHTFEIPNVDQIFLESSIQNELETKLSESLTIMLDSDYELLKHSIAFKISMISVPILNHNFEGNESNVRNKIHYSKRLHVTLSLGMYSNGEKEFVKNIFNIPKDLSHANYNQQIITKFSTFNQAFEKKISELGGSVVTPLYALQTSVYKFIDDWSIYNKTTPVNIGEIIQEIDTSFFKLLNNLQQKDKLAKGTSDEVLKMIFSFLALKNKLFSKLPNVKDDKAKLEKNIMPSTKKLQTSSVEKIESPTNKTVKDYSIDLLRALELPEFNPTSFAPFSKLESNEDKSKIIFILIREIQMSLIETFSKFTHLVASDPKNNLLQRDGKKNKNLSTFWNHRQVIELSIQGYSLVNRSFGSFYGLPYLDYLSNSEKDNPILYDFLNNIVNGTFEMHGKADANFMNEDDKERTIRDLGQNERNFFKNHRHISIFNLNKQQFSSKVFFSKIRAYFNQFFESTDNKNFIYLGMVFFEKLNENRLNEKNFDKSNWKRIEFKNFEKRTRNFAASRLAGDQFAMFSSMQGNILDLKKLNANTFYYSRFNDLVRLGLFSFKNSFDFYANNPTYFGENFYSPEKQPVFINLSDYKSLSETPKVTNGHMTVIGRSGSGKTYFVNSLLYQKQKDHQVFIFDIEDEYKSICEVIDVTQSPFKKDFNELIEKTLVEDLSPELSTKLLARFNNLINSDKNFHTLKNIGAFIKYLETLIRLSNNVLMKEIQEEKKFEEKTSEEMVHVRQLLVQAVDKLRNINPTYRTYDISDPRLAMNPWIISISDHEQSEIDNKNILMMNQVFNRHVEFLARLLSSMFKYQDATFTIELQDLIIRAYLRAKINDSLDVASSVIKIFDSKTSYYSNTSFEDFSNVLKSINKEFMGTLEALKAFDKTMYFYEDVKYKFGLLKENPVFREQYFRTNQVETSKNADDLFKQEVGIIRFQVNAVLNLGGATGLPLWSFMTLLNYLNITIFNREIGYESKGIFVVVDEAHRYLNKSLIDMVELLVAISKQGRKRATDLCLASQNLSDFYRKSDSRDIEQKSQDVLKNTGYKFIMQSSQELEAIYGFIESAYPITDTEKLIIKKLTRGQGLLINGSTDKTPVFVKPYPEFKSNSKIYNEFKLKLDKITIGGSLK